MQSKEEIKKVVRKLFCGVIEMDPADLNDDKSFLDMAVDSMAAVEFIRLLRAEFGEKMTMTAIELYEHSTINKVTDHLFNLVSKNG